VKPVLHIITTICRGGAENQLLVLAREQRLTGRGVSVLYLKGKPELLKDFENIGVIVDSSFAEMNFFNQILLAIKYFRRQENRHLIIHAHQPRSQLFALLAGKGFTRIASRHDAELFFPNGSKLVSKVLARIVSVQINQWVAISNAVKNRMLQSGEMSIKVKIDVVHYGFDSNIEKPKIQETLKYEKELAVKGEDFLVGTVARIVDQKDFPTLLNGFKLFYDKHSNSKLIVVGDGPLKSEMMLLAEKLGISERVIWVGRVIDVKPYVSMMDIFVLASKTEGFGLVLLEAMALGVPVIGANNSAIPEVLGDSGGITFETGNPEDLGLKMDFFISKQNRLNLIRGGNNRLNEFSPKKMRENMDSLYERAEEIK